MDAIYQLLDALTLIQLDLPGHGQKGEWWTKKGLMTIQFEVGGSIKICQRQDIAAFYIHNVSIAGDCKR